jgi:hypothetical protein
VLYIVHIPKNTLEHWRGFAPREKHRRLDKMTNDQKHITVREVEKLMAATKGQPLRGPRPLFDAHDVSARFVCVGSLRPAA